MVTKKTSGASTPSKPKSAKSASTRARSTASRTKAAAPRKTAAKSPAKTAASKPTSVKTPQASPSAATTARKPAVKAVAKPAAGSPAKRAKAAAVQGVSLNPVADAKIFGKKDLFERIKTRSGVKGQDARKVMDAVLDEMGAALVRGETLKLMPLGTVKVQRQKDARGADLVVCKLRRKKAPVAPKDPLAVVAE